MKPCPPNKFRDAIALLQKGRDLQVEALADDILEQGLDLVEGGFLFNEFLETQGTRLHFLTLLICQLEQSADALDEARSSATPPPPPKRKAKPRAKKLQQNVPSESPGDDF